MSPKSLLAIEEHGVGAVAPKPGESSFTPKAWREIESHNLLMTLHTTGEARAEHFVSAQRAYDARQDLYLGEAVASHYQEA